MFISNETNSDEIISIPLPKFSIMINKNDKRIKIVSSFDEILYDRRNSDFHDIEIYCIPDKKYYQCLINLEGLYHITTENDETYNLRVD